MSYRKFENPLWAVAALVGGLRIVSCPAAFLPDFDIGGNQTWIIWECRLCICGLWGLLLFLFRFMEKQVEGKAKCRLCKAAAMLAYGLAGWGFCYYLCAVKAVRDWNDMMNGNVGEMLR